MYAFYLKNLFCWFINVYFKVLVQYELFTLKTWDTDPNPVVFFFTNTNCPVSFSTYSRLSDDDPYDSFMSRVAMVTILSLACSVFDCQFTKYGKNKYFKTVQLSKRSLLSLEYPPFSVWIGIKIGRYKQLVQSKVWRNSKSYWSIK